MIVASVRFALRPGTTLAEATKLFEASAPKYRDVPGLLTKYYVFGGGQGGGIYLWESREAAERLYTAAWRQMIADRYGCEPEIEWLENPMTADIVDGHVLNSAA